MKYALPLLLVVMLASSSALCSSNLLRLERSQSPGGPWQEVPANTLPITTEGAFQDTYESDAGYYRMRIDPADEWGFPLNIPLEEVSPMAVKIADEFLNSLRDGEHGWEEANLGPMAFPMYVPGVDVPAYMEFAVLSPQPEPPDSPFGIPPGSSGSIPSAESPVRGDDEPSFRESSKVVGDCGGPAAGFILVSLREDDFPLVEHSTEGSTNTECLRRMAGTSAVRLVRYDEGLMCAEDEKGELVAYLGAPPVWYPDEILEYCDQEVEDFADNDGEKVPNPPPFEGKAYESYDAFQKDWLESRRFQVARERRKQAAEIHWDIQLGRLAEVISVAVGEQKVFFEDKDVKSFSVEDPSLADIQIQAAAPGLLIVGKQVGNTMLHVEFGDGASEDYMLAVTEQGPLSPQQPTGWTSWDYWWASHGDCQRCYTQEPGGSCVSGCGATAWALLYGYWDCCDYRGYRDIGCDLIEGGGAPLYNNWAVRDCIWYIVPRIGTYCVGSQGATNPWNMYKGYKWATYRGCGISISTKRTAPCLAWTWNGPRDRAIDEIKNNHRPALVGFGCTSAHYALAYGYKYRRYTTPGVTWARQRRVRVNMGWGCSRRWKNAEGLWFAARTTIY